MDEQETNMTDELCDRCEQRARFKLTQKRYVGGDLSRPVGTVALAYLCERHYDEWLDQSTEQLEARIAHHDRAANLSGGRASGRRS